MHRIFKPGRKVYVRPMEFDELELIGIAAGLIAAALFIRYVPGSFALDALVLALAVGPFVLRALRRSRRRRVP